MPKLLFLISFLVITLFLNAQEWCKGPKPAKLDKPPSLFDNKLVSDRFNHTITPILVISKYTQIETAILFRNEILIDENWKNSKTDFTYNIYNSLKLKHAISKKLEYQITYIDYLVRGDDEVRAYDRNNVNTSLAFGMKYIPGFFKNKFYKMAFYGQFTIPKPENVLRTYMSPEIRFLIYRPLFNRFNITYNLGIAYSNFQNGWTYLDGIIIKMNYRKRIEPFAEFYKNYTTSGPPRNPHKRILLGVGFYLIEDFYLYGSSEAGWFHEESLNTERFDLGLTYRFK
ncbi:MAG: hypothetical protein JXB49_34545 [Bacteroidales bacterium]|nr:hypothetical protein [Bacteroidales bacterium]